MRRFFTLLPLLVLIGAGCTMPFGNNQINVATDPLCLTWDSAEGFRAWIQSYRQKEDAGIQLAKRIRLPRIADEKLIADFTASIDAGGNPSFLCTLDTDGRHVVWTIERTDEATDTCTDTFYVSMDGVGTTSDFTTTGRAANCSQLCKPKRLEETLLVWQCDLREAGGDTATWTQIHMNRETGTTDILACQKDALGMPSGCVR